MQTLEMLQTIKWLSDLYSEKTRRILFEGELFSSPPESETRILILNATHEVARLRSTLVAHPFAVQVLTAFNLSDIVEEDWPVRLSTLVGAGERADTMLSELHSILSRIMRDWAVMQACFQPVQNLTTPPEVIAEEDFDKIWTIEIRSEKEITADSLSKVFRNANELYNGIARLMGISEVDQLQAIYVASGSSKRFDLRGLAETIEKVKDLIIELWNQIRYRRIRDSHMNNKALLESLTVLEEIDAQRATNILSDNEADTLRTRILQAAMGLMDEGALIREIPAVETVTNQELLEERQQRLLPPPPETVTKAKARTQPRRRRKKKEE